MNIEDLILLVLIAFLGGLCYLFGFFVVAGSILLILGALVLDDTIRHRIRDRRESDKRRRI